MVKRLPAALSIPVSVTGVLTMQKLWLVFVGSLTLSLFSRGSRRGLEGVLHMITAQAGTGTQSRMDWYLKGEIRIYA